VKRTLAFQPIYDRKSDRNERLETEQGRYYKTFSPSMTERAIATRRQQWSQRTGITFSPSMTERAIATKSWLAPDLAVYYSFSPSMTERAIATQFAIAQLLP